MNYGDEYCADIAPGFDPDPSSAADLSKLFQNARPITRFSSSPDNSFIQDLSFASFNGLLCYKLDEDRMIEINNSFLRKPVVISNEVSDIISFQFVSTVRRSEFLGASKNVHNLGPAIIVSAIPKKETTFRVPKINETIRHVMVHTTLSNLMERLGESQSEYPAWLQEILNGEVETPKQRVLFLEDMHRDLIWACFHLPVSGALLGYWMAAKFQELLSIGLQILKHDQALVHQNPVDRSPPQDEKIRRAMIILNQAYSNPPTLPDLAHHLGISETQLKSGFKALNGTTVLQYCINKRIDAAKLLLNENRQSISEIADIVGYQDHSAFSRAFLRLSGRTPRQWRQSRGV